MVSYLHRRQSPSADRVIHTQGNARSGDKWGNATLKMSTKYDICRRTLVLQLHKRDAS